MQCPSSKFERWDRDLRFEFARRFAEAYNGKVDAAFEVTPESLRDDQDFDFLLVSSATSEKLRVQHTAAGCDPERERVRPKNADKLIRRVREHLRWMKGVFVSLNIPNPPAATKELDRAALGIAQLIQFVSERNDRPALFSYRKRHETYLQVVREYVDDIEIFRSDHKEVVFGWSWSRQQDGAVLGDDQRVEMAVGAKEARYADPSDVVLVVHSDMSPVPDVYLDMMREGQRNKSFLGIWLYGAVEDEFYCLK